MFQNKKIEYEQVEETNEDTDFRPKNQFSNSPYFSTHVNVYNDGNLMCRIYVRRSIALAFLIVSMLFYADYVYSNQLRKCTYTTQHECFSFFYLDDITTLGQLKITFLISCLFSILIYLPLSNLINRKWSYLTALNTILLIAYYHQPPSYLDFSYLYSYFVVLFTVSMLLGLLFIHLLIKLAFTAVKQKMLFRYLTLLLFIAVLNVWNILSILEPNKYWKEGLMGKKVLEKDKDGQQYCNLVIPKYDWKNLLDDKLDISKHYIDCTKDEFTAFKDNRDMLNEFLVDSIGKRYVAFPSLANQTNPTSRHDTQDFLLSKFQEFDEVDEAPSSSEYILDTKTLKYILNLRRNETLVKGQKVLREQFLKQFEEKEFQRKPVKNIIVLYIDTLSRIAFPKKMPKFFKWFEQYQQRNKQSTLYQGMRAHAVASYTFHNVVAYYYGAASNPDNMFKNTPFTVTEKATNVDLDEWLNPRTGKKEIKKTYADSLYYENFVSDIKKAGYITAMTSTDCATSPLSQDDASLNEFLDPLFFDHAGIVPACDPNYFYPDYRSSSGGGPYSVYRRCLYGVELIDYTTDYAKQYLTQYNDAPKFLQMDYLEAHERTQEVIKYQDEKFSNFFSWMEDNGHLKDSVLLFISDHGMHMSSIIETPHLGANKVNQDNGFPVQIVIFNNKYLTEQDKENLIQNEQKLTTLYEVHHFIKYLVNTENSEYFRVNSLVSDQIPTNRTSFDLPDVGSDLPLICLRQKKSN